MDLVWATDENYVFITGVSMVSALENNKTFKKIRIWILEDNISEESKKRLAECADQYGGEICFLNVEGYLSIIKESGARKWGKESFVAYARLFISDMMREYNVDRVIYCDSDLIIDGSLEEIWNIDLGKGKMIGMVKEYNRIEIRDLLDLPRNTSYYQSGLLLIDIDKWRKGKGTERILRHMKDICAIYPFVDQDLLNCVFHQEICALPIQYNVNPRAMQYTYKELIYMYGLDSSSYYTEAEFNNGLRNGCKPIVYHCSDPCAGRPWEIGNHHIFTSKWDYYYECSIWSKWYRKVEYHPNNLSVIQYWLQLHLPKWIYIRMHKYFARKAMQKIVKEYSCQKSSKCWLV